MTPPVTPSKRVNAEKPVKGNDKETIPQAPYEIVHETKRATEIEVEGRTLKLTNREKVMYPRTGSQRAS